MEGKRIEVPATIGFEVDSTLLTVRADESSAHVTVDEEGQPDTVLREPMVVLSLPSGMLTVEQAITAGANSGAIDKISLQFSEPTEPSKAHAGCIGFGRPRPRA